MAAYRRLIQRLLPAEAVPGLMNLSQSDVIDLVQEFSVANERSSAVRYLADMTIKFNPTAVRALMSRQQVSFAEIPSRPLVVVPVTRLDSTVPATLWGDPDPWLAGWATAAVLDGLVPLRIPLGDIGDISALSVEQAFDKDTEALRRFAAMHGADGVVVAIAEASFESPGGVQVSLSEIRNNGARFETTLGPFGAEALNPEAGLDAAAAAAVREVEEAWKRRTMLQVGVGGEITAIADVTKLDDWLRLKAKLRNVPVVSKVELQAMTRNRVQLGISHAGTPDQLRAALSIQAIELSEVDGLWVLTMAGATKFAAPEGADIAPAADSNPPPTL